MPRQQTSLTWGIILGKTILAQKILRRMLPGMAVLFLLTVMAALVAVVLLLAALILLHQYLLTTSYSNEIALSITVGTGLLCELGLIASIRHLYRHLLDFILPQPAFLKPASDALNAFLRGFNAKR